MLDPYYVIFGVSTRVASAPHHLDVFPSLSFTSDCPYHLLIAATAHDTHLSELIAPNNSRNAGTA